MSLNHCAAMLFLIYSLTLSSWTSFVHLAAPSTFTLIRGWKILCFTEVTVVFPRCRNTHWLIHFMIVSDGTGLQDDVIREENKMTRIQSSHVKRNTNPPDVFPSLETKEVDWNDHSNETNIQLLCELQMKDSCSQFVFSPKKKPSHETKQLHNLIISPLSLLKP